MCNNKNVKNYNIVSAILKNFDPMNILMYSKNKNKEYFNESVEIAIRSNHLDNQELAKHILNVFEFWFYKECISEIVCIEIANEIKNKFKTDSEE